MIDVFKPVNISIDGNDQYVRNTQPSNENCSCNEECKCGDLDVYCIF